MSTVKVTVRTVYPNEEFGNAPVSNRVVTTMVNPWSDPERIDLLTRLEVPYFNHYKLEVWDAAEQAFEIVEAGYV